MPVSNAQRKLDPCKKYLGHKLEDVVLACGVLPTHIDENSPEPLVEQICRMCNSKPELHLLVNPLNMDEDGVVHGEGSADPYYPLATISRNIGEAKEFLFIHNGGQLIVHVENDGVVTRYAMAVSN